jgi:uncharacterized membrane protein
MWTPPKLVVQNRIATFRIEHAKESSKWSSSLTQPPTACKMQPELPWGLMLMTAGTSHLTFARKPFKLQVPRWVPLDPETVVLYSGIVEIGLGAALAFVPQHKALLGRIAGTFFTCIFPGNIAQYQHRRNAFGLDTDAKRFARLFFQPALVGWALWSTGALQRRRPHLPQDVP